MRARDYAGSSAFALIGVIVGFLMVSVMTSPCDCHAAPAALAGHAP
jgi:hypothetical protein